MAYVPDPADATQPTEDKIAQTAAAEFRALKAYVQGIVSGGAPGAQVPGTFQNFMLPAVPAGWIEGNGQTIGSLTSGATTAGPQTQALFTAWWGYSDAQLPIFTSAGTPSTRGANAAADWAADKRLTVFDVRARFVRSAGFSVVNGDKYADSVGPHQHPISPVVNVPGTGAASGYVYNPNNTSAPLAPGATANNTGVETAPIHIGMLGCFKL